MRKIDNLERRWQSLSNEERQFVVELYAQLNPKKSHLITESTWLNTFGDIVGFFDPTGIVDIMNGISYWKQGDRLFAVLSWISAVPMLGDALAKPVIAAVKMGGEATKAFTVAAKAGNATKMASAAKAAGGPIAKLVEKAPSWGSKLGEAFKALVGKIPFFGGGMVKVIDEYIQIFVKAGDEMAAIGKAEAAAGRALTSAEKKEFMKQIKPFSGYKGETQGFMQKLAGGMPRLWGNAATRSLMRRTKFYLKFLDWLGIANFIGPDEVDKIYADAGSRLEEFAKTPEGRAAWKAEFGDEPMPDLSKAPEKKTDGGMGIDPFSLLLKGFGF